MTTTSRFWGSLFWGGTTSSCNDDPRSCDGDPTSCDDDPVPADRTPLVEASGMAGAPPWSPMIGSGHAPGRTDLRIAPLIAGLVGFAAGLAMLLAPATGTDLSAQQARAAFAAAHAGAAVDLRWFGGVLPAAYSVVVPYVEAVVGARLTGILAAAAAAPLLALLLVRWHVRRPVWASAWGARAPAARRCGRLRNRDVRCLPGTGADRFQRRAARPVVHRHGVARRVVVAAGASRGGRRRRCAVGGAGAVGRPAPLAPARRRAGV